MTKKEFRKHQTIFFIIDCVDHRVVRMFESQEGTASVADDEEGAIDLEVDVPDAARDTMRAHHAKTGHLTALAMATEFEGESHETPEISG